MAHRGKVIVEIDRRVSEPRELKERKLPRTITATLIVAILFATSVSLLPGPYSDAPPASVPVRISYATHDAIAIIGNASFNNTAFPNNGVVSGNGSASNPYIIEGWEINLTSKFTSAGITIQNADVHFVIRDCYVHDGEDSDSGDAVGIYLYNCRNGTINNNSLTDNADGIYIFQSSNNVLSGNNCSLNGNSGIDLDWSSRNNTVINNSCRGGYYGILLTTSCSNNIITNNTCSSDSEGIRLYSSCNGNTLAGNNCSHNTIYGIYLYSSSGNKLVGNNASWNSQFGVYLWLASGTIVANNTISNNSQYGIRINSSPNNIVLNNTISNNVQYAVYIWNAASQKNRIWNNTFYHNNGSSDSYLQSKNQALDSGGVNWWNSTDGYGNYWADWTTPDVVWRPGIVDLPYNLTGTRHAQDSYPLTAPQVLAPPIPEFSEMIIPMVGLMLILLIFGKARKKPLC